jgi:hypothetical protein
LRTSQYIIAKVYHPENHIIQSIIVIAKNYYPKEKPESMVQEIISRKKIL